MTPQPHDATPQDAIVRFIEQLGLSAKQDGLPRIAGRLTGWFVVHGGPAALSDLAESLQVSRASISTNARLLEQLGVLERVAVPGERQDFYQLSDRPYARLLEGYVHRMRTRIQDLDTLAEQLPGEANDTLERVHEMRDFYARAITNTQSIIDEVGKASGRRISATG